MIVRHVTMLEGYVERIGRTPDDFTLVLRRSYREAQGAIMMGTPTKAAND